MEFMRGNLSEALVGQHKRCVRRRALLSVSLNPYCQVSQGKGSVFALTRFSYKRGTKHQTFHFFKSILWEKGTACFNPTPQPPFVIG
jgi:hypothetical protein